MAVSDPGDLPYTALFCEENIWQLARRMIAEGYDLATLRVLFFSNPNKSIVMLQQRRAGPQGYVVWDYHVVLQAGDDIYDLDTTLPFPVSAREYTNASFPAQHRLDPAYRSWVRVVPGETFVANFYSDRSHMHGVVDETEFPSWPLIMPQHDHRVALPDYIDMNGELADGSRVVTLDDYLLSLEDGVE